jgi:hypothetical protein
MEGSMLMTWADKATLAPLSFTTATTNSTAGLGVGSQHGAHPHAADVAIFFNL